MIGSAGDQLAHVDRGDVRGVAVEDSASYEHVGGVAGVVGVPEHVFGPVRAEVRRRPTRHQPAEPSADVAARRVHHLKSYKSTTKSPRFTNHRV